MVSPYYDKLLNFFERRNSRKYIVICIRCGSENIQREQNRIKCNECGKVVSIKT